MCRISLNLTAISIMFSENYPSKPYKAVRCMLSANSNPHKCSISLETLNKRFVLYPGQFYRFYIVNQGQAYDLALVDLNQNEMQNVRNSFILVIISIVTIIITIFLTCCCRYLCLFLLQYYGVIQHQPHYSYPLSYLQLQLKMKRLEQASYLRYSQSRVEEETCCFCLEDIKEEEKVIELYCRHVFHAVCFQGWVRNEEDSRCPVCKRGFTTVEMEHFQNSNSAFKDVSMVDI